MRLYRHKNGHAYALLDEGTPNQLATYKALYRVGEILCRPLDLSMTPIQVSDLTECEMDVLAPRSHELYRHKVGYAYVILHRALQPETWEDYVIYRGLYGEREVYCLPMDRFIGGGKYTRIGKHDLTPEELTALQKITT